MFRMICLLCALVMASAALFTTVKAPTLFTWKVAILVGEFGHFLWVAPFGLGTWVLLRKTGAGQDGQAWMSGLTVLACVLAIALLLKPAVQAWRVGRDLPGRLERAFGKIEPSRPVFSLPGSAMAGKFDAITAVETRVFSAEGTPEELKLDFFRATGSGPAPCIIAIHAGGWDNGDRTQLPGLNQRLARRGYAVASIDYRLAPRHIWPAQRDDVLAAIAYLRRHAPELGIDPDRLVLLGRSAGGQLAEAVAYGENAPPLRGVIALYAPADLYFAWRHTSEKDVLNSFKLIRQYLGGTPETVPQKFDQASPYLHARQSTPPTLLMHGKLDTLVWHRQSERLAERLVETGTRHLFLDLPWATHAFDFNLDGPGGQLGTYAIDWFLAAVTKQVAR